MVTSSSTEDVPSSEVSVPSSRRAQFNAYRDAADESPAPSTALHGDRPPDAPPSLIGITQLLERLTT
jgi:hypothetical protein